MAKENTVVKDLYKVKKTDYFNMVRVDLLPLINGKNLKVLEIGCGSGDTLKYLKKKKIAKEVVGVEIDAKAGKISQKNTDNTFIENIEEYDLPYNAYFDYILFPDVLEHMINPWEVLKKCKKYLKKDGHIIISIPNIRNVITLSKIIFKGEWKYTDWGVMDRSHLRFFTWKSLRDMIETSGYKVEKKQTNNGDKLVIKIFDFLTLYQLQEIRTSQYLVKAKVR